MPKRSKRPKDRPLRKPSARPPKESPVDRQIGPTGSEPPVCFLSHAHKDADFAYRIETVLAKHGIEAWYAPGRVIGAQDWHDQIGGALERCTWFLLVLSPDAVKSIWVSRELKYALNQQRLIGRIIPLLYRTCKPSELSWTLDSIHTIDFRRSRHSGYAELLRVWGVPYRGA